LSVLTSSACCDQFLLEISSSRPRRGVFIFDAVRELLIFGETTRRKNSPAHEVHTASVIRLAIEKTAIVFRKPENDLVLLIFSEINTPCGFAMRYELTEDRFCLAVEDLASHYLIGKRRVFPP